MNALRAPCVWRVGDVAALRLRKTGELVSGRIARIEKDPRGRGRGLFARIEFASPVRVAEGEPVVNAMWASLSELMLPSEVFG